MELILNNLKVPIEDDRLSAYQKLITGKLGLSPFNFKVIKILKKSLDARDKSQFYYNLNVLVSVQDSYPNRGNYPVVKNEPVPEQAGKQLKDQPIIIGFGPAGIFAALTFIEQGIKPFVFERGKKIEERHQDIESFIKNKELNPESNIQFGEGGAGAYSDGKLTTRTKETGYVNKVLQTFIRFGAPEEISYINKPHLGTDVLKTIIKNIRAYIIENGGKIYYQSKLTDLIIENNTATGVVINNQDKHSSATIILATGHSARDTYELLHNKGITLEQKAFAVGTRIEHPAELINEMQYGQKYKNFPGLGAATYATTYNNPQTKRGVFSFCMCPGGEVINASSEEGLLTVNGMSNSTRSSQFSNSAIVVNVRPEDFASDHPLAGIEFQRQVEKKSFEAGNKTWLAPAQNLKDFLAENKSNQLITNSNRIGTFSCELKDFLPEFIVTELTNAFSFWQHRLPAFVSDQAILIGVETRTSSPVRICRQENGESLNIKNLYPIGEGSGYAGGITSSAIDGIKVVGKIVLSS